MGRKQNFSTAEIPRSYAASERTFATCIKQNVDVLTGQTGDKLDRAITFRDLLDTGVLRLKDGASFTGDIGNTERPDFEFDVDIPPAPGSLSASGAFRIITLSWSMQRYKGHDYFELFRNTTNNIATAEIHAQIGGYNIFYADNVGNSGTSSQSYWYWVRAVNKNGIRGPFNSSAGTEGTVQPDVGVIIDLIEDSITESELAQNLKDTIAAVDPTEAIVTNVKDMYTVKLQTTSGKPLTISGLPTTGTLSASVPVPPSGSTTTTTTSSKIVCTHSSASGSAAVKVGDIVSISGAASLGGAITASILNARHVVIERTDTTFTFRAHDNEKAVEANSSDTGNGGGSIALQFFLPHVSGFGLSNTTNLSGDVTSAFIVRADTFAVINPNDAAVMGGRISPETDMSQMPFAILSGGTDTATGVNVTPGVYMKEAFMDRASIMTLMAGYIQADVIKSGAISSGSTVLTPTINVGAITNPTAHPWQWTHSGTNRVTDFSVKNGIMHANYGVLKGMTIQAFDGTELFRSGGPRLGTGGSLINNGDFIGETVYNEAAEATAIVLGAGWIKSGTGSGVSFADGTVTINASSYIDSEFFPITPGEDLYAEVTGTGLTTSNVSVTVVGYSSASPPAYLSGGSASASGSSWDIDSSTTASAKITVSSTSTVRLGRLRLSVPAGQSAVTFNSVFIGRSPRHIAANYASTYIRNAAVDTLQLAGNAVTVQDVAVQSSNITLGVGNSGSWQTVVTDTFNPSGGGYVATFSGQLTITDDSRANFRMKVNGTVQRTWQTGMRADGGSDVEGEMSSVMTFAEGSTSGNVTVTVEGIYSTGAASTIVGGCLTIDGSKR